MLWALLFSSRCIGYFRCCNAVASSFSAVVALTPSNRLPVLSADAVVMKRKSQIHVSSNGNDDDAYKRLVNRIERCFPEKDEQLTELIHSIQNASLRLLLPSDEWKDDPSLIQIKRLSEQDLISELEHEEEGDDDLGESKDISMIKLKFDSCLDVIKLPIAIPEKKLSSTQFLFVRPDEYVLFFYMNQDQDIVLTGNPGISKSWFQWKYILFCFRQDLYNQLKPASFIKQAEDYQSQTTETFMNIPHRIVRTIGGSESYIFHVNRPNENVTRIRHQRTSLQEIATENSTLLWEPGSSSDPIAFVSIASRIIATVPPVEALFYQFQKNGAIELYMPCPSMTQLRLMGQIYRLHSDRFPSDAVIRERVKKYGPFIRTVLLNDDASRKRYLESQKYEIMSDANQIRFLTRTENLYFKEKPKSVPGFSEILSRFVVDPNPSTLFGGYGESWYECSTDTVVSLIQQQIRYLEVKDWKRSVEMYNTGTRKEAEFPRTCLKELLSYYSTSANGLQWKYCELKKGEAWKDFVLHLSKRVDYVTKYEEMDEGTLYVPSDLSFPFVDMYYIDSKKLIGIKVTTSKIYPKPMSEYLKFRETLGINTNDSIVLYLYYLIWPLYVDKLSNESFPHNFFWKNGKQIKKENENIQFYAILPPEDFQSVIY